MATGAAFSVSPRALASLGLPSFERLCERAGIAPAASLGTDAFFRLWSAVDDELGDRDFGLRLGIAGLDGGYASGSLVALHAPDFRSAVAALSRYKRLTCPERVELEVDGEEAFVRYRWLQATTEVPRLLVDTTLSALREVVRRGTGGRVAPSRLELSRRPMDRALLRRHFGCPVVFGAAADALVFDRSALDVAFVTADGRAFAALVEGLEERLARGAGFSGPVVDVRVTIARHLSEGRRPSVALVARRLATSARTLQRRLDEAETSFQEQLAAVRRTTAQRLLANTDLDPVAIALLLGFAEPNSFDRAFRSWERTTPLRWRARHTSTPSKDDRNIQERA